MLIWCTTRSPSRQRPAPGGSPSRAPRSRRARCRSSSTRRPRSRARPPAQGRSRRTSPAGAPRATAGCGSWARRCGARSTGTWRPPPGSADRAASPMRLPSRCPSAAPTGLAPTLRVERRCRPATRAARSASGSGPSSRPLGEYSQPRPSAIMMNGSSPEIASMPLRRRPAPGTTGLLSDREVGHVVARPLPLLLVPPDVLLALGPRLAGGVGGRAVVEHAPVGGPRPAPLGRDPAARGRRGRRGRAGASGSRRRRSSPSRSSSRTPSCRRSELREARPGAGRSATS